MVDSGREITPAEATNYSPTNKPFKVPKQAVKKKAATKQSVTASLTANPKLYIKLASSDNQDSLIKLKHIIDSNSGATEVVLVLGEAEQRQVIKLPMHIGHNEAVHQQLAGIVGEANIKLS
jgi:hypothetical protein